MKKRLLVGLVGVCLVLSLSGCNKKKAAETTDENVQTEETNDEANADVSDEEGVVSEASYQNAYISTIGEMEDPYSGTIGVETFKVDAGDTLEYFMTNANPAYSVIYANIDGTDAIEAPALTDILQSGSFKIAMAPDGITDPMNSRVITYEFGVPYDKAKNASHSNIEMKPVSEYVLQSISFYVNDSSDKQTGNGLTIPGYQTAVLTKDDIVAALGGEGNVNLVGDYTSSVAFYKSNTCFEEITAEFTDSMNLTKVTFKYDVNFGADLSGLGATGGYDVSYFQDFLNSQVSATDYCGYWGLDGVAELMFLASESEMNLDLFKPTTVAIYGSYEAGGTGVYRYAVLNFDGDPMTISVAGGNIYISTENRVAQVSIDKVNGTLNLVKQSSKIDDGSSVMYENYNEGDEDVVSTDDSSVYDSLMSAVSDATEVTFMAK